MSEEVFGYRPIEQEYPGYVASIKRRFSHTNLQNLKNLSKDDINQYIIYMEKMRSDFKPLKYSELFSDINSTFGEYYSKHGKVPSTHEGAAYLLLKNNIIVYEQNEIVSGRLFEALSAFLRLTSNDARRIIKILTEN